MWNTLPSAESQGAIAHSNVVIDDDDDDDDAKTATQSFRRYFHVIWSIDPRAFEADAAWPFCILQIPHGSRTIFFFN